MKTIQDLVASFTSCSDKTAIINRGEFRRNTYTYHEFRTKILKTCAYLDGLGLTKGDKILLWCYNCTEWSALFLACAVKGIIVVPIDFLAENDYVQRVSSQVDSAHFFKTKYKPDIDIDVPTTMVEDLFYEIEDRSTDVNLPSLHEDDILEIAYTSGTTGSPKGVILTHKNLCANIKSIASLIQADENTKFLSVLPLSHLFEQNPGFLYALSQQATIVYIRKIKPSSIRQAMKEEQITNMMIVPRLLRSLASSIKKKVEERYSKQFFEKALTLAKHVPSRVRRLLFRNVHQEFGGNFEHFICGGAPLHTELEELWENMGFPIQQGYGLTESSPVLTANPIEKRKKGSVGVPLDGVKIRLDDGEILAKGDNITPGYYQDEEETQELFKSGWLKTGDMGEFKNNYLFINGRKKDVIVTSSGMNVYPEDIEEVLEKDDKIKHCCVLGSERGGEEVVYASVIPHDKSDFDIEQCIRDTNEQLNSAQQIREYSIWPEEDFPRTTTMKIKKEEVAESIHEQDQQPTQESEEFDKKLYKLIARVCDTSTENIQPDSVLTTDLGLDSIGRIELVSYIEQEYHIDFSEEHIDQDTTVQQLEDALDEKEQQESLQIDSFKSWIINPVITFLRAVINAVLLKVANRYFTLSVNGREKVEDLDEPVIFVANHKGYADTPAVLKSLPSTIANDTLIAMHTEFFEDQEGEFANWERMLLYYFCLFAGAFPFPRTRRFKQNMKVTGKLLDHGYNILLYPEGEHADSEKMLPFHKGLGFIALHMDVPIVPIRIRGTLGVLDEERNPNRELSVTFGAPMQFRNRSINEVTQEVQTYIEEQL